MEKIKLSNRQQMIEDINIAESKLRKYDRWFDSLKVGQKIYEELMYDSSPVEVIMWNREIGEVLCEYKEGGDYAERWIPKYSLSKTITDKVF